jgi:hypothetical protein
VVYFPAGLLLSPLSDIIIGFSGHLAFRPEALCSHFFNMPADRMEKHPRIFRIQYGAL